MTLLETLPERPTVTKPYYQDERVALYHGDCLELADLWTCADVLVTDPPYGVGGKLSIHGFSGAAQFGRQDWDTTLETRDAALSLWGDRPAAVFGSPRRIDAAPPFREVPLVWDKGDAVATGDTTFPWRPTYELIYVSGPGWSGHRGKAVLTSQHHASTATQIGHPTPKPVGLMTQLIHKAPPGIIADPFAGSGSTGVAAKALGRRAILVELEERFCEIAARRLSQDVLDFTEATV